MKNENEQCCVTLTISIFCALDPAEGADGGALAADCGGGADCDAIRSAFFPENVPTNMVMYHWGGRGAPE